MNQALMAETIMPVDETEQISASSNDAVIHHVIKRNGHRQQYDQRKVLRLLRRAATDLPTIDLTPIIVRFSHHVADGVATADLHTELTKTVADMISEQTPDYALLAGRLNVMQLRKEAFGTVTPPSLREHITSMVRRGLYVPELLDTYTDDDFAVFEQAIDHQRDMTLSYAATEQLAKKYLVGDRVARRIYESPQMAFICIAMTLYSVDTSPHRNDHIIRLYNAVSTYRVSLATPIMAGARTPVKQFSSCVLIECADSLDSIIATSGALIRYVSRKAGIGINVGAIRAKGSPIRGGEAEHTGCTPFYQLFEKSVTSCSQGGVRNGAATLFYPLWHREVRTLLMLGDPRTPERSAAKDMNYGVQINGFLYERLLNQGHITLFSPHEVPDLYAAFFTDQQLFQRLYIQYENDPDLVKDVVDARQLFTEMLCVRANTGRLFIQHVDHCNNNSPFDAAVAPIRQSNLCMEIALPTKPLNSLEDEAAEIALCTLSSVNLGALRSLDELEEISDILVRTLDNLLSYQSYPLPAAANSTRKRRTLGIGVSDVAHYLAKHHCRYSDGSGNALIHRTFEALQYYCLVASSRLAEERGMCDAYDETSYARGVLPIDRYCRTVDDFCNTPLQLDWEALRLRIARTGLRNSTVTAVAPTETSSQITNSTAGVEPPRALAMSRNSRSGSFMQLVPDLADCRAYYETASQLPNNIGLLQLVAIMQKFVDQAISVNTHYDLGRFDDEGKPVTNKGQRQYPGKLPISELLADLLRAYRYGVKTLYYHYAYMPNEEKPQQEFPQAMPRYSGAAIPAVGECPDGVCSV